MTGLLTNSNRRDFMPLTKISVLALLAGLSVPALAQTTQDLPPLDEAFERDVLVVEGESLCHRFDVWLALSRRQQMRGLMFVREMPDTSGMFFIYPRERDVSIWMRNTYIPLDIIFARADGVISYIEASAETMSDRSIDPGENSRFVLELNGGMTARLGISPGGRLLYEYLESAGVD